MKIQLVYSLLVGAASAAHPYMDEAMRGERKHNGVAVYDEPEWEPSFDDSSPPYRAFRITRENWEVSCTSEASLCKFAIDGLSTTSWRSQPAIGTHNMTIDLQDQYAVSAVVVLPPVDLQSERGLITEHEIYVSNDKKSWTGPVALGMWPNTNRQRLASFEPISARFVRLVAPTSSRAWFGISEINVYANLYTIPQDPSRGIWGPTIDLPVVPAAAAQEAGGQIMLWSSWSDDRFASTPGGKTAMARWDFRTRKVTKRVVTDTHHDMFCPGIAIDGTGKMVVSGGNDAATTSLYDAAKDKWEPADSMHVDRGYHAATTLSDGRVFIIGGSWAGQSNVPKYGEVYSPATQSWTKLPGARVEPMYTNDIEGPWRADNHAWLFGWKNNTVLQAGPSIKMNWYGVDGDGSVEGAGERTGGQDSMSGNAVMFDAVAGKILTFGGSPDYDKDWAHKLAHILTLDGPNDPPKVERAGENGEMNTERVFHSSVVLPDGTVFISGGQDFGVAFNEEGVKFTPELYDPKTNKFTKLQKNNMIRVYHSVSILSPDATVLTGGGGLCGTCASNHYDAQVFTPPYLLTPTGELRKRPEIVLLQPSDKVEVGGRIVIHSRSFIPEAALVRISSNSHTVNTDQRRVPLKIKFLKTNPRTGVQIHQVILPTDPGILIPGQWMLFLLDEAGTPSIAKIILITNKQSPALIDEQQVQGDVLEVIDDQEECDQGYFRCLWQSWMPQKLIVHDEDSRLELELVK